MQPQIRVKCLKREPMHRVVCLGGFVVNVANEMSGDDKTILGAGDGQTMCARAYQTIVKLVLL